MKENDRLEYLKTKIKELLEYDIADKYIIAELQKSDFLYSIEEINKIIAEVEEINRKKRKEYMKQYGKQYYIDNKIEMDKKNKIWNETHKEIIRKIIRKSTLKKYDLTLEQYDEIYNKQEGKCAICGKHQFELKQSLCVDHDHTNNNIRGLICVRCNRAIGMLEDNVVLLQNAINYLNNNK